MTLPRPPWEFRSQRDARQCKAWINRQLVALGEHPPEYFVRHFQIVNDEAYIQAVEQAASRQLKRCCLVLAAEQKNFSELDRLTENDRELKNLAFRLLAGRRARGRQKGARRPGDLTH